MANLLNRLNSSTDIIGAENLELLNGASEISLFKNGGGILFDGSSVAQTIKNFENLTGEQTWGDIWFNSNLINNSSLVNLSGLFNININESGNQILNTYGFYKFSSSSGDTEIITDNFSAISTEVNRIKMIFWTDSEINSFTTSIPILHFGFENQNNLENISFGKSTSVGTNETITIIDNNDKNLPRTYIRDNIPAGWNTLEVAWSNSLGRYEIILNGTSRTTYPRNSLNQHVTDKLNLFDGNLKIAKNVNGSIASSNQVAIALIEIYDGSDDLVYQAYPSSGLSLSEAFTNRITGGVPTEITGTKNIEWGSVGDLSITGSNYQTGLLYSVGWTNEDSGNLKFYINDSTYSGFNGLPFLPPIKGQKIKIGENFNGQIGNVSHWSNFLTSGEIKTLYADGGGTYYSYTFNNKPSNESVAYINRVIEDGGFVLRPNQLPDGTGIFAAKFNSEGMIQKTYAFNGVGGDVDYFNGTLHWNSGDDTFSVS